MSNQEKKGIKVRMRAEESSTKCSFAFKCIHAIRQNPIPARSPAEREGADQEDGQGRGRERGDDDDEEEGRG